MRMFLLIGLCALCGALGAQYTRTTSSAAYVERTGTPAFSQTIFGSFDDDGIAVTLPFDFAFFDHTYRHCFMNTNGRVSFNAEYYNATSNTNITSPVSAADMREAIHGISVDLFGSVYASGNYAVFIESGRVVFQWNEVTLFSGSRLLYMNFQIHLLQTGVIEFHYGPEFLPVGSTTAQNYVSGLVNGDGTTSVAGFNNVTTQQTARPAANDVVTFTPAGFTPAAGVRLMPPSYNDTTTVAAQGATNVRAMGFRLSADGAGDTVTQLAFVHQNYSAGGDNVTFSLVVDTAPLGQFNGEAVIGSAATVGITTTVTGLTEVIGTGVTRDYLLLATLVTVANSYTFGAQLFPSGALPATVRGGVIKRNNYFGVQPICLGAMSHQTQTNPAREGTSNNRLVSFRLWHDSRFPGAVLQGMDFTLAFSGSLMLSDLGNLRLWRDNAPLGVADGNDVPLGPAQVPAATTSFSGFSESTSTNGTNYLLTFDVSAIFTGNGRVTAALTALVFGAGGGAVVFIGSSTGDSVSVLGSAAQTHLRSRADAAYGGLPVQPGDLNCPANAFSLQTSNGAGSLTQLVFIGSTTRISAARLYLDTGTLIGRFDAGDTQVSGTVALNAGDITISAITGQALSVAPVNYLLVVDIAAAAAPGSVFFDMAPGNVTTTPATTINGAIGSVGTVLVVGAGIAAPGIDLSIGFGAASANFGGTQTFALATLTCTARGAGGTLPIVRFNFVDAAGGVGNTLPLVVILYLEGAGPLGQLDASDRLIYRSSGVTMFSMNSISMLAGQTLNFLMLARRDEIGGAGPGCVGTGRLVFFAITGGTNLQLLPAGVFPEPRSISLNVQLNNVGGGDGGGGDDGGCTTGETRAAWLVLLSLLACLTLATRLRRLQR